MHALDRVIKLTIGKPWRRNTDHLRLLDCWSTCWKAKRSHGSRSRRPTIAALQAQPPIRWTPEARTAPVRPFHFITRTPVVENGRFCAYMARPVARRQFYHPVVYVRHSLKASGSSIVYSKPVITSKRWRLFLFTMENTLLLLNFPYSTVRLCNYFILNKSEQIVIPEYWSYFLVLTAVGKESCLWS